MRLKNPISTPSTSHKRILESTFYQSSLLSVASVVSSVVPQKGRMKNVNELDFFETRCDRSRSMSTIKCVYHGVIRDAVRFSELSERFCGDKTMKTSPWQR
jgi:hypothetical protein